MNDQIVSEEKENMLIFKLAERQVLNRKNRASFKAEFVSKTLNSILSMISFAAESAIASTYSKHG